MGRQSTVSAAHLPTTNLPQPPAAVGKEARRQGATRAPPAGRVSQGRLGRPGEYWRGPPTLGTLGTLRLPGQHLRSHAMR